MKPDRRNRKKFKLIEMKNSNDSLIEEKANLSKDQQVRQKVLQALERERKRTKSLIKKYNALKERYLEHLNQGGDRFPHLEESLSNLQSMTDDAFHILKIQ